MHYHAVVWVVLHDIHAEKFLIKKSVERSRSATRAQRAQALGAESFYDRSLRIQFNIIQYLFVSFGYSRFLL
jgi:hypothetical protein